MRSKDFSWLFVPSCIVATTFAVWVAYKITGEKNVVWLFAVPIWLWFVA